MDSSLRKTHRRIWIILAILLPIIFVAAIMFLPKEVEQDVLCKDVDKGLICGQLEQKHDWLVLFINPEKNILRLQTHCMEGEVILCNDL